MFKENPNYYPTPYNLARRMFEKLEMLKIKYILEPSAGSAHLIEHYKKYYEIHHSRYMGYNKKVDDYIKFDAIEIDPNLNSLLRGKGINVVWDDFLTFESNRFYDLVLANFPFDRGADHFLKSIEIQQRIGGQILGIINAETIKNPYSNKRKELITLLEKYNADIEYVENAFVDSERQTAVEVAIIHVSIPMQDDETMFEREFKRDNPEINFKDMQSLVVNRNKLEQLIFECEAIKKAGIELFKEKMKIESLLKGMSLKSGLKICNDNCQPKELSINDFINNINFEYWQKFIEETDFKKRLPSKLRNNFTYNMEKQKDITFNMENVRYFYEELIRSIPKSYEETVAQVFDSITSKHYYSEREWEKNIYCYSGWKSNNGFKINSKCIIPCYNNGWMYSLPDILTDLNIVFENIGGEKDDLHKNNNELLNRIKKYDKKIETTFFILDAYKKNTLHVTFKNKDYLRLFNVLAGKGKNALPPDFGQKSYQDMDAHEKNLVKEFGLTVEDYIKLSSSAGRKDYLRLY